MSLGILKQSTAYNQTFFMVDSTDHITGKAGLTPTVTLSKNGAAFAAAGGSVTEISSGWYYLALSTTDTNTIGDLAVHATGTAADPTDFSVRISARIQDDMAYPATSGRSMVVDANGLVDANVVKIGPTGSGTAQTARDIGASVLLSSGAGAGQLDFTSGVVKASLVQILGNAISGTASQISAAFTKFFDKASPTGTINSIPDAVAGAAGGLFIAGTNAATTVTTALTTTFTGNLTGSVGSVTGAVGSVTGSVGSVATGGIAAASFAAGAIDAAAIAADAIGSSELATTAVNEIRDAILSDSTSFAGASIAAIKAKTDSLTFTTANQVDAQALSIAANAITATAIATDAITAAKIAADAIGSSELATTAVNEIRDAILSDSTSFAGASIAAIKAKTDSLTFTTANQVDATAVTVSDKTGYSLSAGQLFIKKNTALANFEFLMTDATTHAPMTGLTVTSTRSIDGGALASTTNSASELSNGLYKISFSAADLNGTVISFRMTATGADDLFFTVVTQA